MRCFIAIDIDERTRKALSDLQQKLQAATEIKKSDAKWVRPELSFVPWAGYEKTNILMDVWCSYASVNIKPEKAWPYEMTIFRHEASIFWQMLPP